ncbi:hypothetical protein DQ04_09621010 [Trypanosoma grayi]|uniref:hypothetical protein n=1 Tax=Trypanosoma grayi TaxID=71804 RepID=UPI0004F413E8|nr:hypothetical protein DQ04_09621010 [Trypanosoma grayi]KEG07498.1 hypothetical protein DQ04_09621010 [Trypanosoma grayi]
MEEASAGGAVMPYVVRFRAPGLLDTTARAAAALEEIATALRSLLQFVELSDVPNERYAAHRAMQQPARADAVGVALYLTRAMVAVSVVLMLVASRTAGGVVQVQENIIAPHFASLCRQMHAIATPVIKHSSVANVMVRTTSLVQYFGGLLATLPTDIDSSNAETAAAAAAEGVRWIANRAIGLSFVRHTMVPTITVAMRSNSRSEKLSALATQASTMLREQLEGLRVCFADDDGAAVVAAERKRPHLEKKKRQQKEEGGGADVTVDDVLFALTAEVTAVQSTRKDAATKRETLKIIRKRSRSGDAAPPQQQQQKQRR